MDTYGYIWFVSVLHRVSKLWKPEPLQNVIHNHLLYKDL